MSKSAIVAIGYNRPDCMKRLLDSLKDAVYLSKVDLIISIDYSGSNSVEEIANDFIWSHGEKRVIHHSERLGLKKHVLSCGSFTQDYDYIVVFEDDLYVSKYFFDFVEKSVDKYKSDTQIAGIGLYSYDFVQNVGFPFTPIADGYDVFFLQQACSLGQIWIKDKWDEFYKWYLKNSESFQDLKYLPANINRWDEKSWLKYYNRYCVEKDKFFVYPRTSLVTDWSPIGSHAKTSSNKFQLPLLYGEKDYKLPSLQESRSVYDAFYENMGLGVYLGLESSELCVDTYGGKTNSYGKRYWLTTKELDYKVIRSFGLTLRPRDANIINPVDGEYFFLYDTSEKETKKTKKHNGDDFEIEYVLRDLSIKKVWHYCNREMLRRFKRRLKK